MHTLFTTCTGYELLSENSAAVIVDELLPAQESSYALGLALGLPVEIVESIHTQYTKPFDQLLHITDSFLKQEKSIPTWRNIIAALQQPEVKCSKTAKSIEEKFCHSTGGKLIQG